MTKQELLQDYKIKYIDNARPYSDGDKNITRFFYKYFNEMSKKYKTYKPLAERMEHDDFTIILEKRGTWWIESNILHDYLSESFIKKVKHILNKFNYRYLWGD
jgi:hypothetical protein